MKVNQRYVPKMLSKKDTKKQLKELIKSRNKYKHNIYYTRKKLASFKNHPSKHVIKAQKIYKIENIRPTYELAKKTGCNLSALKKIVNKGEGAYFSSGSRPNQTAQSWGLARLASAITGGKSSAVDFSILNAGCKRTSRALKLAIKNRGKWGTGHKSAKKRTI